MDILGILPLESNKTRLLLHMHEVKGLAKLHSGSYFRRRSLPTVLPKITLEGCIMRPLILSPVLSTSALNQEIFLRPDRDFWLKLLYGGSMAEWFRAPAGVVIRRSWVQVLHPATSWIYFTVVPSSNLWSRFVYSQLVCLLPVGIFNHVLFIKIICFLCFSGMPAN